MDVNVKVVDDKPWRAFATLDNSGTGDTGYWRAGFGLQHTNLFDRDHVVTGHYVTSPTQVSDVTILGLGYRVPFYALNGLLDLTLGYSDVNSGTVQGLFSVSGSGTLALVYLLPAASCQPSATSGLRGSDEPGGGLYT